MFGFFVSRQINKHVPDFGDRELISSGPEEKTSTSMVPAVSAVPKRKLIVLFVSIQYWVNNRHKSNRNSLARLPDKMAHFKPKSLAQ